MENQRNKQNKRRKNNICRELKMRIKDKENRHVKKKIEERAKKMKFVVEQKRKNKRRENRKIKI